MVADVEAPQLSLARPGTYDPQPMRTLCWALALSAATLLAVGCARQVPPLPVSPPSAQPAARAFAVCLGCHSAAAENRPTGPSLYGLMGRKAGTHPGYFYSEAIRNSGITWDEPTLDRFLANPSAMVPGTFMLTAVPDAGQRAELVHYLATLPAR